MTVSTAVVLSVAVLAVTATVILVTAIRGVVESIRIRHGKDPLGR